MFRRIGRSAPGVILLPARALTADHVRPRAAQPGILHRLVRIDGDVVGRRDLGHVQIVPHHVLAGEPFTTPALVNDVPAVADISRFDGRDAVTFIQTHRVLQLRVVVGDGSRGLVVADQFETQPLPIRHDRIHVEIRIGLCEAEFVAIGGPIAIPALVPALDQHAVEAVFGREIHVALGVAGGGPMLGAAFPSGFVDVHFPPDTHEFSGLDIGHAAELVGFIEIELNTAVGERAGGIGDQHRAPWSREGS